MVGPPQTLAINVCVEVAALRHTVVERGAPEAARYALRTRGASKAGIGGTVHRLMDRFYSRVIVTLVTCHTISHDVT